MSTSLKHNLTSAYLDAARKLFPKRARRRIVAYVESYDDIAFWRTLLSEFEYQRKGGKIALTLDEGDELLPAAIDVVMETGQASVSMLQRRLKLGYSRAARLVDQMEELGIVGPFEGSKPRQLLITREQWQEMSMSGRTPMEQLIEEQKDDFSAEERL